MNKVAVVDRDTSVLEGIDSYLAQVADVLGRLPVEALERMVYRLEEARWKSQQVFTCGNGGSAATAIHFASDLSKGALAPDKPPIKAESLCDNIALLTAWANDVAYDEIFAQQMTPWVKPGDVLIAISGSGNSANVLRAVDVAKAAGATTIGFTGFNGGKLKGMVDICITVASDSMEQIEDVHLLLCHLVTTCLRNTPPELLEMKAFAETAR
jgi:D-sedoheptulose 7-phosphate isomerase